MKLTRIQKLTALGALLVGTASLSLTGCKITHVEQAGGKTAAADSGKGGGQLWAENCVRCHNVRSPSTYSDTEWEVAAHHMRIRANLTAEEHRKILQFLKSAN